MSGFVDPRLVEEYDEGTEIIKNRRTVRGPYGSRHSMLDDVPERRIQTIRRYIESRRRR